MCCINQKPAQASRSQSQEPEPVRFCLVFGREWVNTSTQRVCAAALLTLIRSFGACYSESLRYTQEALRHEAGWPPRPAAQLGEHRPSCHSPELAPPHLRLSDCRQDAKLCVLWKQRCLWGERQKRVLKPTGSSKMGGKRESLETWCAGETRQWAGK